MNKILKTLRKHWTRVWLIVVILLSCGIYITHAAYTEVTSVKRVVSTKPSPGQMFSSNCMRNSVTNVRMVTSEYTVTVCNYDHDKPKTYNPSKINYTLHAELVVRESGETYTNLSDYITAHPDKAASYRTKAANYSIRKTSDDDPSVTVSDTPLTFTDDSGKRFDITFSADELAPQKASVDKYNIVIDSADLELNEADIYVHIWAVPTTTGLSNLDARLFGSKVFTDSASWDGTIIETDCNTVDYDFYNYVITGSGKGTVDILWDPSKFEINPFFFSDSTNSFALNPTDIPASDTKYSEYRSKGWKKCTLNVDSTGKNRYELQLYKTYIGPEDPAYIPGGVKYTGDNAATNYIACFFTKSNETT